MKDLYIFLGRSVLSIPLCVEYVLTYIRYGLITIFNSKKAALDNISYFRVFTTDRWTDTKSVVIPVWSLSCHCHLLYKSIHLYTCEFCGLSLILIISLTQKINYSCFMFVIIHPTKQSRWRLSQIENVQPTRLESEHGQTNVNTTMFAENEHKSEVRFKLIYIWGCMLDGIFHRISRFSHGWVLGLGISHVSQI